MGVTGLGALIAIALAYMAQSPRFLARIGLAGARLDLRVREFTGYALAFVLLAFGFFLAGVPLGTSASDVAGATAVPTGVPEETAVAAVATPPPDLDAAVDSETPVATGAPRLTPESGAFGGPPPAAAAATAETDADSTTVPPSADDATAPAEATVTATPIPTTTAAATTTPLPTGTPTDTPTVTPTPTLTPTPIVGETAVIQTGGSTLWVRRSPGGQQLTLVRNGDVVILTSGHANRGGILWQEVRTVDGVLGWVQEEFLQDENES